jgi:hypothetical protein
MEESAVFCFVYVGARAAMECSLLSMDIIAREIFESFRTSSSRQIQSRDVGIPWINCPKQCGHEEELSMIPESLSASE